jgi:hypothetical protein
MNSSAKITVSFLAAAALGAAVVAGCTVGSGTVNDTDGGTQTTNDSGPSGTDAGGDTGTVTPATCTKKNAFKFSDVPKCETCLDTKCCTPQQTCFNIPEDTDAGKIDCNGYVDCIDNCTTTKTGTELEDCYKQCDDLAGSGVQAAYDAIVTCADTNCQADCSGEVPDGG